MRRELSITTLLSLACCNYKFIVILLFVQRTFSIFIYFIQLVFSLAQNRYDMTTCEGFIITFCLLFIFK
jgi:hypothetical protein